MDILSLSCLLDIKMIFHCEFSLHFPEVNDVECFSCAHCPFIYFPLHIFVAYIIIEKMVSNSFCL